MAETAKKATDEKSVAKKGRARKVKTEKASTSEMVDDTIKGLSPDEKPDSIREQIENCKNELAFALRQDIRAEYQAIVDKQVAKANRRRRWNNFFHDIVIVALAALVGFLGYCLYDVRYFDFMKSDCEKSGTCMEDNSNDSESSESAGPVKDATWYLANYSYLFENIQTKFDANSLAAYYLYTNDHKVEQIRPDILASMAYNQVEQTFDPEASTVEISEEMMRTAFQDTFGSTDLFEAVDFAHDCLNFKYSKAERIFVAKQEVCPATKQRRIIEQIERIYEEGEVMYILTTAVVFDELNAELYNFDNLFQPVIMNVSESNLNLYTTLFNRYQYQFKKSGENYYLSSIIKLR